MTARQYAAVHTEMLQQRAERRWLDRPLRAGDLVQVQVGGEIREVVAIESAGLYVERMAMARPSGAQESSAAGRCALYGG